MNYRLLRVTHPFDVACLISLLEKIPQRTHDPKTFYGMLARAVATGQLAVWGLLHGNSYVAVAVVAPPSPADFRAHFMEVFVKPGVPKKWVLKGYKQIFRWAKGLGAKGFGMITTRSERAFGRAYKFKTKGHYMTRDFVRSKP